MGKGEGNWEGKVVIFQMSSFLFFESEATVLRGMGEGLVSGGLANQQLSLSNE